MNSTPTPVINITDLYHPHQDVGDNFDLLLPFALSDRIELLAVIMDGTQRFREAKADHPNPDYRDHHGPRDSGFIPMIQLNSIFGKNVPCGVGPYSTMSHVDDTLENIPLFQQSGVQLILDTLNRHPGPVEVTIFGSCRTLAVAYNRDPELLKKKIKRVHINAGTYPAGYLEWNVMLDPFAFQRLVESDLPIALYPCATEKGPFDKGRNNTFWQMPDLDWVGKMPPKLRRYLGFALQRVHRMDFLRALEEDWPELEAPGAFDPNFHRHHDVWETAIWMEVAKLRLVQRSDRSHRLLPEAEIAATDRKIEGGLKLVEFAYAGDGQISISTVKPLRQCWLYERSDPAEQEKALCEALPELYRNFLVPM